MKGGGEGDEPGTVGAQYLESAAKGRRKRKKPTRIVALGEEGEGTRCQLTSRRGSFFEGGRKKKGSVSTVAAERKGNRSKPMI